MRLPRFVLLSFAVLSCGGPAPRPPASARVGEPADIASWGAVTGWEEVSKEKTAEKFQRLRPAKDPRGSWIPVAGPGNGRFHLGIAFDEPRRFQAVRIVPADPKDLKSKPSIVVQFWQKNWPNDESGGWAPVDDDYHGKWTDIPGEAAVDGDALRLDFPPLGGKRPWPYRVARKVRVVLSAPMPIRRMEVLSTARWKELEAYVQYLPPPAGSAAKGAPQGSGRLEFHNGYFLSAQAVGFGAGDKLSSDGAWTLRRDAPKAVRVRFLGTDAPDDSSERTLVTVRGDDGFTVSASLLGARPIWVAHAGAVVGLPPADPAKPLEIPAVGATSGRDRPGSGPEAPPTAKSYYHRVLDVPEQTYERAAREIPQLDRTTQGGWIGLYLPLGAADHRQEMCVRYTGDFMVTHRCLKSRGRDEARFPTRHKTWDKDWNKERQLVLQIPTGSPANFREKRAGPDATTQGMLEDHLPVVLTRWRQDGIDFEETAFATLTEGDPTKPETLRGDEPMVLCARITASNRGGEARKTTQWIAFRPRWDGLRAQDGWLVGAAAEEGSQAAVRLAYVGEGPWDPASLPGEGGDAAVARPIALEPGASVAWEIRWPFGIPASDEEAKRVASIDFDAEMKRVADFWRGIVARGAHWEIPERYPQDFWRANLCHVYITADKDVDSGHVVFPAGTIHYNVCANEAVHQLRSLDLRGHHAEAQRGLDAFLACQGSRILHGRYKSAEGALHGLKVTPGVDYQAFNYNLDHGFVLWMLTEHYKLTGDRAWLEKNAARFVAACDFITRERKPLDGVRDKAAADGEIEAWHAGLLPEGHLEDPPEFLHWYTVNAYAYRGFRETAAILAEIGHPEATRLKAEAEAYGNDLRRAIQESRLLAPAVPLRDGRSIPFFPTRCHLRGRDTGWIRDALYGPVHFIDCGLFAPRSREADWILEDAEDNVYVSASHGRKLRSEADWFSWGGITIQSNLLPGPLVYLAREEEEHAIRAFYNSFAADLYADVRAFTEHPVSAYGAGAGPFYKTPDESAWVTWMRYLAIREDGERLWIGQATPRGWLADGKRIVMEKSPTYFGPVGFTIESASARGEIRAAIDPPARKPCQIVLRLRHPEAKPFKSVEVNGKPWADVDPAKELIRLGALKERVEVTARY